MACNLPNSSSPYIRVHFGCGDDLAGYFERLKNEDKLPPQEELFDIAQKLSRKYSTTKAYQRTLHRRTSDSPDEYSVPLGSPWEARSEAPPPIDVMPTVVLDPQHQDVMDVEERDATGAANEAAMDVDPLEDPEAISPEADVALANSIIFLRDGILQREASRAVQAGDMGRVWEVFKVCSERRSLHSPRIGRLKTDLRLRF